MPKDAFIRARTDADLKRTVEGIFAQIGLNTSEAINLFFHQVELHNGLPFDVKIPNSETLKAPGQPHERLLSLKDFQEVVGIESSLDTLGTQAPFAGNPTD